MKVCGVDENTQRADIIHNIQENVFVEAGAGAGKTTLIVERIMEQLKSGVEPEQIVVITFTNKAAEELRGRIITRVMNNEPLRDVYQKIDQMNISTIHSFCFKLLGEQIFEAKLPMDFCLLEQEGAERQQDKIFSEYVGGLKETDWEHFEDYELDNKRAIAGMKEFYRSICELPDGTDIKNDSALSGQYAKTYSDEKKLACRYVMLLEHAIEARKKYRRERSRRLLTNDDLLQKTYHLLCAGDKAGQARAYFAKKYKCIYVDEFQDTDRIQEQFIWQLAADPDDPTKLRDGALFLVGDPKQSIYRFRGAQPEIYFEAKRKMGELDNAKVYCLNYNFRSNETLVSWVNQYFKDQDIADEPYADMVVPENAGDLKHDRLLVGHYCIKVKAEELPDGDATKVDEIRLVDAKNLSELIHRLVRDQYEIIDKNDAGELEKRPIRYSDFLVLCAQKEHMDIYFSEMKEKGIPVIFNGKASLRENSALNSYVRLFHYLTNPYDRTKRFGAAEALKHAGYEEVDPLLEAIKNAAPKDPHEIAGYLLSRLELLLPVDQTIGERELRSVQTKLEQMYENILAAGALDDIWHYIDADMEYEMSLEEQPNAVRFMNLHKAKGLEGNIVILTDRCEKMKEKHGTFHSKEDYYPAIRQNWGKDKWTAYDHLSVIKELAVKQELQEQTRLAYVAATRAKQVFIVTEPLSDCCMFYDFEGTDLTKLLEADESGDKTKSKQPELKPYKVKPFDPENHEESVRKAVYKSKKPSDFEQPSSVRAKANQEKGADYKPDPNRPKGNVFGTVMHRSFQLLIERWRENFRRSPKEADLQNIIEVSIRQAIMESRKDMKPEDVKIYYDYLKEIATNFAWWAYDVRLFRDALEVYTELPFSYYEDKKEEEKKEEGNVWMNGTADLIIKNRDEAGKICYQVLDYKSDHDEYINDEEIFRTTLDERYKGQLEQYCHAVKRLFGGSHEEMKVRLQIISFKRDKNVRVTEFDIG